MAPRSDTPGAGELAAALLRVAPNSAVADALAAYADPGPHTDPAAQPFTSSSARLLTGRGVHGARLVAASPDPGGTMLATLLGSRLVTVVRTLASNPDLRIEDAEGLLTRYSHDIDVVAGLASRWPSTEFLTKLAAVNPDLHTALSGIQFHDFPTEMVRQAMRKADIAFGLARPVQLIERFTGLDPMIDEFARAYNRHLHDPGTHPDPVDDLDRYDDDDAVALITALAPRTPGHTWDPRLRARAVAMIDAIGDVRNLGDDRAGRVQTTLVNVLSEANLCDDDVGDYVKSTSPIVWEALTKSVARGTVSETGELLDALAAFVLSGNADDDFFRALSELCPTPPKRFQQPFAVRLGSAALGAMIAGARFSQHQAYRYLATPGLSDADIVGVYTVDRVCCG